MKNLLNKLFFFASMSICISSCTVEDYPPYETIYQILNNTERTVYIQSSAWRNDEFRELPPNCYLHIGHIISNDSFSTDTICVEIEKHELLLKSSDWTLLRRWTPDGADIPDDIDLALKYCYASYFEGIPEVRLLHKGKYWESFQNNLMTWTFEITPEDLIPLSEIASKYPDFKTEK